MDPKLRRAWKEQITAEDIDAHLRNVGQAEANASLILEMLGSESLRSRVLVAGAGTGQMFDYTPEAFLREPFVVFSDINQTYLCLLRERVSGRLPRCLAVLDDIEQSALAGPFDVVVAVLLLEHVEWRKALDTMTGWHPKCIHTVIQRNPPDLAQMLTPTGPLPPSIAEFGRDTHPELLKEEELVVEMGVRGYWLRVRREREVPGSKVMIGLSFNCL
jgi:hypothetical protein